MERLRGKKCHHVARAALRTCVALVRRLACRVEVRAVLQVMGLHFSMAVFGMCVHMRHDRRGLTWLLVAVTQGLAHSGKPLQGQSQQEPTNSNDAPSFHSNDRIRGWVA